MKLRNINSTRPTLTSFSLSLISFEVRLKNAKNTGIAPQAIFGIASISLLAATVKLTRLPVTLFKPLSTPKRSFVPPILTAKSFGKLLPLAWVFCSAIKTGSMKNAARPIPRTVKTPIFRKFIAKTRMLCQRTMW